LRRRAHGFQAAALAISERVMTQTGI
jgi:hypothetical protein